MNRLIVFCVFSVVKYAMNVTSEDDKLGRICSDVVDKFQMTVKVFTDRWMCSRRSLLCTHGSELC